MHAHCSVRVTSWVSYRTFIFNADKNFSETNVRDSSLFCCRLIFLIRAALTN
jgi:hypothetical protein